MLFHFLTSLIDQYSFLNVFKYLTFRTGLSVITSLVVVFIIGGPLIKIFSELSCFWLLRLLLVAGKQLEMSRYSQVSLSDVISDVTWKWLTSVFRQNFVYKIWISDVTWYEVTSLPNKFLTSGSPWENYEMFSSVKIVTSHWLQWRHYGRQNQSKRKTN